MPLKPINPKDRLNNIIKNPRAASEYAIKILKKRWPAAEPIIMKDPLSAFNYANIVLKKKRWPEAEPFIMKDPNLANLYALKILKRRWPEAEPYIMKDPENAYFYAYYILKKKWPEAEPYIMNDHYWGNKYINDFEK